jgi:aspartyl/asparaginyl beta-hydroxylase (cupin superfamily)
MTTDETTEPDAVEFREQIGRLERMASELARNARHDEAERIYGEIARVAPNHAHALHYLGSRALVRGDLDTAQEYFVRTIRLAPRAASAHQNLGVVLRARGYPEGALRAFGVALQLKPDAPMIWLQRGDMLRTLDREEEAIAMYQQGEQLCGDLLTQALQIPEGANQRKQLLAAAHYLARARTRAMDAAMHHNGRPLAVSARVRAALQHMSRAAPPSYAEPLQRPGYAYVPDLHAKPFFERRDIPQLGALERETDAIREELLGVLAEPDSLSPYVDVPDEQAGSMAQLNHSTNWGSYHLYENGKLAPEHAARCPRTMAAIEALPLARMAGHAPSVLFSVLQPGAHIPPHHGFANYKLVTHLPLIVPPGCAIRVGDQTRSWTPGECLVLDDTFEHEAWNRSDKVRVVMIFEIWNPGLDAEERVALASAQAGLSRLRYKMAGIIERTRAGTRSATAP